MCFFVAIKPDPTIAALNLAIKALPEVTSLCPSILFEQGFPKRLNVHKV
jgi:hypothetical protein